ncbi:hypothetical protein [Streptomyces viridochromogenes]|uniref:hypothetical protein n=1 Tax=Streptomyces viridochromogenes TaxID=1938 RepID=UPI0003192FC5|nr:hypothetical protein [Streptomyces viridochromogenes]
MRSLRLRLTEEERDHLRPAQPNRNHTPRVAPPPQRLRPTVQHLLDRLGVPAFAAGAWTSGACSMPFTAARAV